MEEVWKQQTLLQLLHIVELPILDCILVSPAKAQLEACRASLTNQDLVISNTCLDRELPNALNLPQSVHVKHLLQLSGFVWLPSLQFKIHHSDHCLTTMFCLQVGSVAFCCSWLLGTVTRPVDCGCGGAAEPSSLQDQLWRSTWRADNKQKETALCGYLKVLQWTRKTPTTLRTSLGYTCSNFKLTRWVCYVMQ